MLSLLFGVVTASPAYSQDFQTFDVPEKPLAEAIHIFSNQSERLILFPYALVENKQGNAVHGRYDVIDALNLILQGTGLEGSATKRGVLSITEATPNSEEDTMTNKNNILAGFITLLSGVSATEAAEPAPENFSSIEEIVVTAQKRVSNAQDTAIAMDVLGSERLLDEGVGDIAQLTSIAPGLQIGASATASIITLRGVSGRDTTEIGDPAVAINVDGVFLQRPSGMNASFFDLERIEVLRGPQGTLYGRNATGGVVNIISKRPDFELGGYGSVSMGNFDSQNFEGAVNVPLSETLAMRASYVSRYHEGYRDNSLSPVATDEINIPGVGSPQNRVSVDGDDEDVKGSRLQFLYDNSENFTVLLSGTFIDQGGNGSVIYGTPAEETSPPTDADEVDAFPLSEPGDLNIERQNILAQVDYDFGGASLTYIYGKVDLDVEHLYDNDGTEDIGFYEFRRGEFSEDVSHEIRLSSNGDGPLEWQVGGFYYDQKVSVASLNYIAPEEVNIILRNYLFDVEVESVAGFAHVSYDIADDLSISAGVRYSEDTKSRSGTFVGGPSLGNPPTEQPELVSVILGDGNESKDDDVSYHFGIDCKLSDQNLVYAKIDKGYKSGGFTSINEYGPETVQSLEVGSKNRFLDNTLQLNVAVFTYDYTDQQVSQLTSNGVAVQNAGSSTVNGIEVQTDWLPTANSALSFSVNWLDATFDEFEVAVGGENVDQSGNSLIQAPEWAISGAYEYTFAANAYGTFTPRIQFLYRSESYFTIFNTSVDEQEAYTTLDISLKYQPNDADWSILAYAKNVTDELVLTSAAPASFTGTNQYQFAAPRTYGVRVSMNF